MITTNRIARPAPGASAFQARYRRTLVALGLAALFLSANAAQACDIRRDADGRLRWNCRLSSPFKDRFRGDFEFAHSAVQHHFVLPNLLVRKVKLSLWNMNRVELYVDVRNDGARDSSATDVAVTVDIVDPLTGQQ